jgi:hypothetical protein
MEDYKALELLLARMVLLADEALGFRSNESQEYAQYCERVSCQRAAAESRLFKLEELVRKLEKTIQQKARKLEKR